MRSTPKFALVTVLFNSEKYLPAFVESLSAQRLRDFLLIVVDNASRDRSLAEAKRLCDEHGLCATFIENGANLGIAKGNNQGILAAQALGADHIVLLNNDIRFSPDLLELLSSRIAHGKTLVWTPRILLADGPEVWYAGGHLSFWLARGVHWAGNRAAASTQQRTVTYAPTCFMCIQSSVLERVGLMDERYFVYYDDTDFCRRLQEAAIPIVYDPSAVINHYVGGSSGGDMSSFFLRTSTRNKFLYIAKFYRGPSLAIVFSMALASKLLQMLASRKRAGATWKGLQDYAQLALERRATRSTDR